MANAIGWNVSGKRITLKQGLGGVTVLVDGAPATDKLKNKGTFEVPFGAERLTLVRKAGFMGVQTDLSRNGLVLPQDKALVARNDAAPGAVCATHEGAPATLTCAVCGTFCCSECESADGVRCKTCFGKAVAKAAADRKALAYMAPVLPFFFIFGLIPALLAAGAGGISMAVAKSEAPRAVKLGVAVALYGIVLVASIALTWFLIASKHQ